MRWFSGVLLWIVLAGVAPEGFAQSSEINRAETLIREGKAEAAWRLLSPLERQHAGQPEFDFALAVAARESGRPNLATFALERVLVMAPGNLVARLELARALLALRDFERAERELELILNRDPPSAIRAQAARYRETIPHAATIAEEGGLSGYVEAALGHDSNATIATAQGSIFIPSLGTELALQRGFVREPDNFAALGAGLEYVRALAGGWSVLTGADLHLRRYAEVDISDSRTLDLHAGLRQRLGARDSLQYTLRHNDFELDHAGYRRMQSATAEWSRLFGERARLALSAQGYRLRYPQQDTRASSSDVLALSANGAYVVDAASRTIALGGLFAGFDNAVAGRADGDRRIWGASGGLQRRLAQRVDGYASVALLRSEYRQENADFGVTRRDRQLDLALGLSWKLAEGWSLRPQVVRTRNRSNIELNDYGRTQAEIALRRSWD